MNGRAQRRPTALLRRRRAARGEDGVVAMLVAMTLAALLLGLCALGLDVGRWAVEQERLQKAADAAALAGVTFMPGDVNAARATAIAVARRNGITDPASVQVTQGERASQLRVTITRDVPNTFGAALGIGSTRVSRTATADYTGPAPMGSPCNTFGNEPPSQPVTSPAQPVAPPGQPTDSALPATPFPNCSSAPLFWAAVEGPATDKQQGDRFLTTTCSLSTNYGCTGGRNTEHRPEGYFFAIHVEKGAVGVPIDVQVYDPAFVYTTITCSSLPSSGLSASMNDWTTTDGGARYGRWKDTSGAVVNSLAGRYCTGDYNPGASGAPSSPPTTSFALRSPTDTGDPRLGTPVSGCAKQFRGVSTVPTVATLKKFSSGTTRSPTYNPELARVFHQWVSLCQFTPTRAGDHFLQVRTNVAFGGTLQANRSSDGKDLGALVSSNTAAAGTAVTETSTVGLNSFGLRAVPLPVTTKTSRSLISVSGYSRMPILQNANSGSVTFNLIRAVPATRGQFIAFSFYDAADGATNGGTVRVLAPGDAKGDVRASAGIPGCRTAMGDAKAADYKTLTGCSASVKPSTNNAQLQRMIIPIPADYTCDPSTLGGCWFSVEINFTGSSTVTDFTTWEADIGGDPVRLVQ